MYVIHKNFDQAPKCFKPLIIISLLEVASIKSVLTKVKLEAMSIDSAFRDRKGLEIKEFLFKMS